MTSLRFDKRGKQQLVLSRTRYIFTSERHRRLQNVRIEIVLPLFRIFYLRTVIVCRPFNNRYLSFVCIAWDRSVLIIYTFQLSQIRINNNSRFGISRIQRYLTDNRRSKTARHDRLSYTDFLLLACILISVLSWE